MEIRKILASQTYALRHQVLWPNMPLQYCMVDGDEQAQHVGGYVDGQLVCVASIFINGGAARLRKFAILSEFQRQGIGTSVVKYIIADLVEKKVVEFWCDAREDAIAFYKKFGLTINSERFYKKEIPYFKMSMKIN